jgi:hypothetical protein
MGRRTRRTAGRVSGTNGTETRETARPGRVTRVTLFGTIEALGESGDREKAREIYVEIVKKLL